ncbi:hypothetical protein BDL97_13G019800 [Sphagnum fallax]|nr:hypothetical protein BDL97_13G019800 [Sphagnum fallax]
MRWMRVQSLCSNPKVPHTLAHAPRNWWHAGYHLTVSIAAPALLSLPFALDGLGWAPGFLVLTIATAVSFYAYTLISKVLEQAELEGHRFLRFRDLAGYVLGRRLGFYPVGALQIVVCLGAVVGSILLGGESIQIIYQIYKPNGSMQLYEFIIIFGTLMLLLSQLPSFHSLRYINLVSLVCCLGYSLCVVGGSIYVGHSRQAPSKSYSVKGSSVTKMFTIFNSLAIIITTFGNGIIPEIQATLAPPVSGKMFKGLLMCYAVVIATFFSVAGAGYWAFGNASAGNIFLNFAPSGGVQLIPNWLLFLANMFVIAELFAVALVYSQPTFEIFEGRSSSVESGKFSKRNLLPRLIIRSIYVSFATLIAAALPFFGDINAIIGAFGFTPLDFVLPFVLYNVTFKPSKRTIKFWLNYVIIVVFTIVGLMGCISAVRQIVLDASSYKLFANV